MSTPVLRLRNFLGRLSSRGRQSVADDFTHTASQPPSSGHAPADGSLSGFIASQADDLASRLPALLLEASHVAASLSTGQHGLHRAGSGESFWQYRQAQPGEPVSQIDWRQSARSQYAYVRETEAEAPQTVLLWCDLSASMQWRSASDLPEKRDRALLLLLATASLLLRSGERVRILTPSGQATRHATGTPLERLALGLLETLRNNGGQVPALPAAALIPRYCRLIIVSDFLCDDTELGKLLSHCAGQQVRAHLVQIGDPAERTLPYKGHITFEGLEQEPELDLQHVQSLQDAYQYQVRLRETALTALATRHNHSLTVHNTNNSPLPALMSIQAHMHNKGQLTEVPA
ncbi:DUF58 domain-containing protein [Acetobacter thailandicus]|uniref:DUF58 domain-containing protein n=1 Tax=Acetobacter thailandicus TaxID=1502842 RepID=A0ABT3QFA1_9PROT|nr:DUF58 domain-containing protein [Acetobacter thailandicus]MCX2563963.1 DUF58 domain-containing protein [Acetobacter thailandicus]NHN94967.1 DUF58 domain-containing protein [Acetobacter thailandicus]